MNVPMDISKVVLKTKRLKLRAWRKEDLDDFYAYASVDGVGQMAGWLPHKNKEESQRILERFIAHKKTFALEYENKVIGSIGIEEYDEKRFPEFMDRIGCELGFVLSKTYWGQGLMPEALKEVIRYLFKECQVEFILCGHFISNIQSGRVQEKCGFKHYSFGEFKTKFATIEKDEVNILINRKGG
ncbi:MULTISPECIES: GNAT family N-acetyltransferase [Terrabacteria group]|uniref:GNAT family N-acetyltransferase n=1 Tax=Bacillati TaxID=1783272 RepID=UPI0019395533|nr:MULTISPECIES: GNAT family N-acetyltransferase [Terrabacteria group]MBW9211821.1 GNAT family N-acetyltransferase [Trueperella sp. zg.1013]QRG87374.1 GNAT family N-acetyltransferase [Bulleidia sp. zg-1006]